MKSALCEKLGIDFPLFAFSHCRDVAAAVSRAGGMGVFGAVTLTPEQLETDLST
jgi:NAD(P)H-dependent flavin oxidoreductase YrpB (nitropropane dioxygenase family)